MKKKILSLALALAMCLGLLPTTALAANYTEVIPCKYARVGDFSEGLAAVAIQVGTDKYGDGIFRWGFIDKTGKEVIPCQYVYSGGYYPHQNPRFSEGLAAVRDEDNKCGYIDRTGKAVIPFQYDDVAHFSEGLAIVGLKNGKPKGVFGEYPCDYGYIDKTGNVVVTLQYDYAHDFSEGLAAVRVGDNSTTWKWGYIDKMGKEVIPLRPYRSVSNFSEDLAAVCVNGKWGYIDKTGKEVIPCQYTMAGDFSEGLASIYVGEFPSGKYGFIDKTGKVVIPTEFDTAGNGAMYTFSEGLAVVMLEKFGGVGFIDKTGREVFSTRYNAGIKNFSEGLAVVNHGGKCGYIDKTGKEVVPCQYAWTCSFSDGMAAVAIRGENGEARNFKWGFICLGDVPVAEQEQPTESEKPTVAADSDLVIVDGVLTK